MVFAGSLCSCAVVLFWASIEDLLGGFTSAVDVYFCLFFFSFCIATSHHPAVGGQAIVLRVRVCCGRKFDIVLHCSLLGADRKMFMLRRHFVLVPCSSFGSRSSSIGHLRQYCPLDVVSRLSTDCQGAGAVSPAAAVPLGPLLWVAGYHLFSFALASLKVGTITVYTCALRGAPRQARLLTLCHSGGRVTLFDAISAPGRWTENPDIVCLLPFCSALYLTFAVDAHIFAPF